MAVRIARSLTSTLRLNDGVIMPMFGLGTGPAAERDAAEYHRENPGKPEAAVLYALKHGYRMVDTAQMYLYVSRHSQ